MSTTKERKKLPADRLKRAIEGFQGFCEEDLEWRRNSGDAFDEGVFTEARDLVMRKLEALKEESL